MAVVTKKCYYSNILKFILFYFYSSTKYPRQAAASGKNAKPIVVWKMKAPDKKPLVRRDSPEEVKAKVRRGSQKKATNPMKALAEFQGPDEMI